MSRATPGGAVVVPAVNAPSSTLVLRSLGRLGVHTVAVSEREAPPAVWSRYCDEWQRVPSPREDLAGYRDALLELARREDVRTVVPMREEDVYALTTCPAFADHVATPWPTAEQLRTVHDRERLFAAADRAGVAVPDTRRLDEVDDWDRQQVVKGRYALVAPDYVEGAPADRITAPPKTVFLDPGERPDADALVERMGHVPHVQSFLRGPEFSFRALYDDGEAVATSQKRLVRGIKYSRGPSVCHEAVALPGVERAGRALLEELDWHGVATVQFIHDGEEFRLLEVNPRFWSSMGVDVHAGVDYPALYWGVATGERTAAPAYRPGVASHTLRGELVHLHSVLREEYALAARPDPRETARDIAASLVRHPRFDYLSLDDPGPFLRDALNTARQALGAE